MDVPPIPHLLMTHRKRLDMTAALQSAVMRRQPDAFVEAAIRLVMDALAAGKAMTGPLRHEHRRLVDTLTEAKFDRAGARTAATALLSNVLVPWIIDEGHLQDPDCIDPQARHLHALGLIDAIRAGRRSWWSSPIGRTLVSGATP